MGWERGGEVGGDSGVEEERVRVMEEWPLF